MLELANRLRAEEVDAQIDQYEESPGWPQWTIDQIETADFVLMVCTEVYRRRFRGKQEAGQGLGVRWEGAILTQELYDDSARRESLIPIVFCEKDKQNIPKILRGLTHYDVGTENGYDDLLRRLKGQPRVKKPELGRRLRQSTRERRRRESEQIWNVPFRRNPFFTGRGEVLEQLHQAFVAGAAPLPVQLQVLRGLGGVGKTQTALEYAYRYRDEYQAVFWVRAEAESTLKAGLVEIARLLELREKEAQNQDIVVEAVLRWLEHNPSWLLIFDNADTPEILRDLIPANHRGHIILTSRAHVFDVLGTAQSIPLKELPPAEAQRFLRKRTGQGAADPKEARAVAELAEELGYLPLALEQAAAYIHAQDAQFQDYLAGYQRRRLDLLRGASQSVATTWDLNFRRVEETSETSAEILRASAFLHPDEIPLKLLALGAPDLGPVLARALADATEDPLLMYEILEPLTRYSLIYRNRAARTYSLHRLVQEVLKERMEEPARALWARRVVRAVKRAFPEVRYASWSLCNALLPQAKTAAELSSEFRLDFEDAGQLLNKAGLYSLRRGRYAETEWLYQQALAVGERSLGGDHPEVAESYNRLASLYKRQGRYEEAEPLYRTARDIWRKRLGEEHEDVGTSHNNLALLYRVQGRYAEAEPLLKKALEIFEKALEPDHPYVATSLNNLAQLYQTLGRYAEAEPLQLRALRIREAALGPDQPDVATSLNNLAYLYRIQGRYREAEPLYRRALEIRRKAGEPDHPDVAQSLNNLAQLYRYWGHYAKAEPLFRKALKIREGALGRGHSSVATSLNNLAQLYEAQGLSEKAEELYGRALEIREKALGPEHPRVASVLNNLAQFIRIQGRVAEAEPLQRRALSIWQQAFGPEHPDVATGLSNLALVCRDQNHIAEAEPLQQRALEIFEKALGPDHPEVAQSLENYAALLRRTQREKEAEDLEARARKIRRRHSARNPSVVTHPEIPTVGVGDVTGSG